MPAAPILIVQHDDLCPPGRLGRWLEQAGYRLEVVQGHHHEALPEQPDGFGGLVVLGGQMGAYDDEEHPWLVATKRLLRRAVADGVPTLGVCLGHQLLAVATGGRVAPSKSGQQAGLHRVGLTGQGQADPLLVGLDRVLHWNNDLVVAPPPRAAVLARTPAGIQAIRIGNALGVQFHPEVDPAIVGCWANKYVAAGRMTATTAEQHLAALTAADAELAPAWRAFARRFAAAVGSRRRAVA